AVPIQYTLIGLELYPHYLLFIPILCLPLAVLRRRTAAALLICVYALSHVTLLPDPLMLYLVVIAQSSDVLQYIAGKLFGRHLVAPKISPHKTVEGLIGGIVAATALGIALRYLPAYTVAQSAVSAFLIA